MLMMQGLRGPQPPKRGPPDAHDAGASKASGAATQLMLMMQGLRGRQRRQPQKQGPADAHDAGASGVATAGAATDDAHDAGASKASGAATQLMLMMQGLRGRQRRQAPKQGPADAHDAGALGAATAKARSS